MEVQRAVQSTIVRFVRCRARDGVEVHREPVEQAAVAGGQQPPVPEVPENALDAGAAGGDGAVVLAVDSVGL
ncbi:hypothetical protein [Catellatospora vulcania]|uniref:hypothetical protein n=1 Tax=Catellatospora vulcania TaxID=1460450 RepID=UPI0012D3F250|nr:hypothetical protein [Catellatospora vulcania]